MPLVDENVKQQLVNEFNVLHLIYLRSKNQFRTSYWWHEFSGVHRYIARVILIIEEYESKETLLAQKVTKFQKEKTKNKFIANFSSKQLYPRKKRFDENVYFLIDKFFPKAWRTFHNLLALGQFITLGFAMLASLAKIMDLLKVARGDTKKRTFGQISEHPEKPDVSNDEDVGEVVKVTTDSSVVIQSRRPNVEVAESSPATKKTKTATKSEVCKSQKKPRKTKKEKKAKFSEFDSLFPT